ncbi:GntR family transcriptional regulator [Salinarimonas soli]|uniref:GntR family transcriptional regulator n=1 Tax=Salinarimonas soli TaxID=1638099 RepID=A0A5B2V8T7_9HYPH|nr:GntR family transcriptional regulator [Salinarimonas soli]KAA2234870.1 GntR family transcriptional regulator [Salinarimonas soli]
MSTGGARLRNAIEDLIATGALAPGERLDETQLAARFHVSRTPVREALHQLAASGFVEIRPRRGAVVATIAPARLVEMFEVMGELEAMAGRLAARRARPRDRAAIGAALEACRKAAERGDPDAYYADNELFHLAIYEASGNAFLAEQASALHRRLRPYRRLQLRVGRRVHASLNEHERIAAAIAAGDPRAAARELRAHIVVQGERFSDLVAGLSSLEARSA